MPFQCSTPKRRSHLGPADRIHWSSFMSFAIYLIGTALFIGGVAWALVAAHVPQQYIAIACLILLGIGIFTGVTRTRTKDPA